MTAGSQTTVSGKQGCYGIVRQIGGGGQAVVYEAVCINRPTGWPERVAIKQMQGVFANRSEYEQALKQFVGEASLLMRLSHSALPRVFEFFERGQSWYLVMEFVEGCSLEKLLVQHPAGIPEFQVLRYALQVCDVLAYLHGQSPPIIFRDLKPSNIMITPQDSIKLVDFGIARRFKHWKRGDTVQMGSPGYAAPEQYGLAQTDCRSDIYSLGATLFHALTGQVPPSPPLTPPPYSWLRAPRSLRLQISPEIDTAIRKAMEWEPKNRFASIKEFREALARCPGAPTSVKGATSYTPPALQTPTPCPTCGGANRVTAKFCIHCGQRLTPTASSAVLRIILNGKTVGIFPLASDSVLIGRASSSPPFKPELDLSACDPSRHVSRRHARLFKKEQDYFLIDLKSLNGTLLNGTRLHPEVAHPLRAGDVIEIGDVKIVFQAGVRHN